MKYNIAAIQTNIFIILIIEFNVAKQIAHSLGFVCFGLYQS